MELKLNFSEVLGINNVLKSVIEDETSKINVLLKFRLLGLMKAFEPYISSFEIIKNEKIMEYGKENSEGNFQISRDDTESMEKFRDDLNQVLNSEVTVNLEMLTPKEAFDNGLKTEHLMALYPIICRQKAGDVNGNLS